MRVKVYATLRDVVGGPSVELGGCTEMTVNDMLETLWAMYPELRAKFHLNERELHPALHILLNGRDVRYLDGLATVATGRDDIRIFPPVGGGSR